MTWLWCSSSVPLWDGVLAASASPCSFPSTHGLTAHPPALTACTLPPSDTPPAPSSSQASIGMWCAAADMAPVPRRAVVPSPRRLPAIPMLTCAPPSSTQRHPPTSYRCGAHIRPSGQQAVPRDAARGSNGPSALRWADRPTAEAARCPRAPAPVAACGMDVPSRIVLRDMRPLPDRIHATHDTTSPSLLLLLLLGVISLTAVSAAMVLLNLLPRQRSPVRGLAARRIPPSGDRGGLGAPSHPYTTTRDARTHTQAPPPRSHTAL